MPSQETSVFIQTNGSQSVVQAPRASISGRPLLRSSTSSNPKTTTTMMCNEKTSKIICGAVTIVVALAVVIVVFVLAFNDASSTNGCEIHNDNFTGIPTSSSPHHDQCFRRLELLNDCRLPNHRAWIIVNKNSKDFASIKKHVPEQHKDPYSAILISPHFQISSNVCSFRVSLNVGTNASLHVYLNAEGKHHQINMTSGPCRYGEISDQSITSQLSKPFHFIVTSSVELSVDVEMYGSMSAHHCTEFQTFEVSNYINPTVTANPEFVTVRRGVRNLCSAEIHQGKTLICNWMGVQRLGNSDFERLDNHQCLNTGISHRKNDGMVWFFGLPTVHPTTDAYLISPVMEAGGSSRLVLSFWYRSQCNGSSIRIYLLDSYREIRGGIPRDLSPVRVINDSTASFNTKFNKIWKFAYFDVAVPESRDTFQILIQGVCHRTTCTPEDMALTCRKYKCKFSNIFNSILGIDDIGIEMRYEQCRPRNGHGSANINCSFQDSNGNATTCTWNSTQDFYDYPPEGYELRHWRPINQPEEYNRKFLADPEHFEGHGHILHFDASGKTGSVNHWFRSPVVIGNSNCSCVMSFLYLLRSVFAPKLSINMVVGSDVTDLTRPTIPQWSIYGHQNDSWLTASVLLNIRAVPFQFEVRVTDLKDSRGDVFIDDIVFSGCDFRLF